MVKFLLPLIALAVGAAGGAGGAIFLGAGKPADMCDAKDETAEAKDSGEECKAETAEPKEDLPPEDVEYLKLSNQFIVPVVKGEVVHSLVVLSLSLEVATDARDGVFAKEPKLRDAFLSAMFDHAHSGAFDGPFTESGRLDLLRRGLLEAAHGIVGKDVSDVLITDIVRQEVG